MKPRNVREPTVPLRAGVFEIRLIGRSTSINRFGYLIIFYLLPVVVVQDLQLRFRGWIGHILLQSPKPRPLH